jgi:membrane fusion protein (multidrug efflux system)
MILPRKRILLPFELVAVAVLFLVGCGDGKPETPVAANVAPPATPASHPATAAPVKTDDFLTISAPLIVEHQVDVTAQRDGTIVAIAADAGARVSAGTELAKVDNRQLSSDLEAARAKSRGIAADLKNWEAEAKVLDADYVRAQRLFNEKLIAEEQLQHAQYKAESDKWDIIRVKESLNTAKQEEQSLEIEMEKTVIKAPFSGLVARRYIRVGQTVAKGDRLFWVTAEAPLRIRFTLPEKYFGHIKKGQEFSVVSPDVLLESHSARVIELSPVVDPASGTMEVLVEVTGSHGGLRPGMTASVRVPSMP